MSNRAITWAYGQRTGSPTRKSVLVALADQANSDGECWPGQKAIAEDLELTDRAVRKALADLADKGFISVQNRRWEDSQRQRTNYYVLNLTPEEPRSGGPGGTTFLTPEEPRSGGPGGTTFLTPEEPRSGGSGGGRRNHVPPKNPKLLNPKHEPGARAREATQNTNPDCPECGDKSWTCLRCEGYGKREVS